MGNSASSTPALSRKLSTSISGVTVSSKESSTKSTAVSPGPNRIANVLTITKAVERKDWKAVQKFLQVNPDLITDHPDDPKACSATELALREKAPNFIIETILSIDVLKAVRADSKGLFWIHYACKYQASLSTFQLVKQYDVKAHERLDNNGNLPIHYAAKYHAPVECLDLLLKLMPDSIKAKSGDNLIPLLVALESQAPSIIVERLVKAYPESIRLYTDLNLPIHFACKHKPSLSVMKYLLDQYPESINLPAEEDMLPIHISVACKANYEVIQYLAQKNQDNLMLRDKSYRMPLHYALEMYSANDIIIFLLRSCPDSAKQRGRGTPGDFPLHIALEQGFNSEVVLAILNGYREAAKVRSVYRIYALRTAIARKLDLEIIEALLDEYPTSAEEVDEHGRTALHYAVSRLYPSPLIEALIKAYPLGVSHCDNNKQLPIHLLALRATSNMQAVDINGYQNYVNILSLLLDRYPQCAYMKDRYRLNAINYLIEQNAFVDLYRKIIEADVKCLQVFGEQGRLPLHHAIECRRDFDIIQLLVKSYPQSTEAPDKDNKIALHLAILRPLSIESLLCIEEYNVKASSAEDNEGNLPVHYALQMHTSLQLTKRLLASNLSSMFTLLNIPDEMKKNLVWNDDNSTIGEETEEEMQHDTRVHCCQETRLLHYAVAYQCPPNIVAEIMTYTMPYKPLTYEFNRNHYDTWTHLLAHTEDKYWQSIEALLNYYDQETIVKLSVFLDGRMRRALDMATPKCRHVMVHRLHYFSRYELAEDVFHITDKSILKRALDHSQGLRLPVMLMYTKNSAAYENEVTVRRYVEQLYSVKQSADVAMIETEKYLLRVLQTASAAEDKNYQEEANLKGFGEYPYLVVSYGCKRSLGEIIRRDNFSLRDERRIIGYCQMILEAVEYLHRIQIVHGNIHPDNIFEYQDRLVLGDFSHALVLSPSFTSPYPPDPSTPPLHPPLSCAAPEVAALLLLSPSTPVVITTAQDMWSVGAVWFHLTGGESLFLPTHNHHIDRDQMDLLAHWPDYAKQKRMKKIPYPILRNLLEQLLSLDPLSRPPAALALSHPLFTGSFPLLRYVGMEAKHDLFLSWRYEEEESSDLRHRNTISSMLTSQGYTCMSSLYLSKRSNLLAEQMNSTLYNMSQSRGVGFLLSRYAINCPRAFSLADVSKDSPLTLFLFEMRLALELKARGLLEQGVFVVAIGDTLQREVEGWEMGQEKGEEEAEEEVFGPFFIHYEQEMVRKSSGCLPDRIPNVVNKALDSGVEELLMRHGLGKSLFKDMGLKEMINALLDLPTLHFLGPAHEAYSHLSDNIVQILSQQVNKEVRSNVLRSSRPASSFQRMFNSTPLRTPTNWLKDREHVHIPPSPLHTLTIPDIIVSGQGFASRPPSQPPSPLKPSSPLKPNSRQRGRTPLPLIEGDEESNNDITFLNNPTATINNFSMDQALPPNLENVILPYFTEIVHVDKEKTKSVLQYLYEKVDVKETEISNLKVELKLLEERVFQQQKEMSRLRGLVRVTDPHMVPEEEGEVEIQYVH